MTTTDTKIWEKIAAPIPQSDIQWRVDGEPSARDGKYFARYVAYVDAQFVRDRLDSIVPGNWDLTLELMPFIDIVNRDGVVTGKEYSFKARLQIMGTIREDVGTGDDYKSAASDAFKRAAVRYGVAHELYSFEQNWVEVDGDGKYAKPVEDPQKAYERRWSGVKTEGSAAVPPQAEGGNANLRTAASPESSASPPVRKSWKTSAEKTMPFGKTKGKTLGSLSDSELEKTAEWCRSTDAAKFKDLIGDIETVLNDRSTRPVASGAGVGVDPDSYPDALRDSDDSSLPF